MATGTWATARLNLGHPVLKDLPEAKGEESDRLYLAHIAWLEGKGRDELDELLKIERN